MAALVKASGLTERTFLRIARATSWKAVKIGNASAFCLACGVDLRYPATFLAYIRKLVESQLPFKHLSPLRQRGVRRRIEALVARKRETAV
jgi:hypothetical protein